MKFRPEITRVKLNPEQAVLTCNCYSTSLLTSHAGGLWLMRLGSEGGGFCYDTQTVRTTYFVDWTSPSSDELCVRLDIPPTATGLASS